MFPADSKFLVDETLKGIIGYIQKLKDKAKSYAAILDKYLQISGFPGIHNSLILTSELLIFYHYSLFKVKRRKYLRHNDLGRIQAILRMVFINSFSIIEYSTKELVKEKKYTTFSKINNQFVRGKRIYFSQIMKRSKEIGLIDEHQKELLYHIRMFRNALVHNDGYLDRAGRFEYTLDNQPFIIEYAEGKLAVAPLHFSLQLVELLMGLYFSWVKNFLEMKITVSQ